MYNMYMYSYSSCSKVGSILGMGSKIAVSQAADCQGSLERQFTGF